ncbi:hypothetical protein [Geodermatophilus sp. CPCC 205506]|uniref:hypothetical protein n=1 Tax=Geodermatophilus sp. CPCC 205506 TaxID=2936596 RepID=UPI003EE8624E
MSRAHLQMLELDPQQVNVTVAFLEACANTSLAEASGHDDRRGLPTSREGTDREWVLRMDAASALRDAAQWAAFLDPQTARRLLIASARQFQELDHGFGMFLMAVAGAWRIDPPLGDISSTLAQVEAAQGPDVGSDVPAPLRHPQQQAYVLLAAAGTPGVARADVAALGRLAETSRHRLGVVPVGALGTPLRRFWDVALHLLVGDPVTGPPVVFQHLESMSRTYAESIDLAMTNHYLWRHGAAPVDTADLDIMGMTVLSVARFGMAPVADALGSMKERLTPIARIPMELGMELAEAPPA